MPCGEAANWIVTFGFRREKCERDFAVFDELKTEKQKLINSMYFMLTTFSTVGYGDLYAISQAERLVICVLEIYGVTVFAEVMSVFAEELGPQEDANNKEEKLHKWFEVITSIRMSPFNKQKDISDKMKAEIEAHF